MGEFFSESVALYGTLGINTANFLATFITVYAVDKFGRVLLLVMGGATMCVMLLILGCLSLGSSEAIGVCVIVFTVIFVVSFAYSWGPVVWVVCSEIFPLRARGKAAGITTATNWVFTTIVGALFPLCQKASLAACFFFFCVVIGVGSAVAYLYLPETANLNILQIDTIMHSHLPSPTRPGLCSCNADGKTEADALPLTDAASVPAAVFDRASGSYQFDEPFSKRASSASRIKSSTSYSTFNKA